MLKRFLLAGLCVGGVWANAWGAEGTKKEQKPEVSVALEARVLKLEDEIAELKQTILLLRDRLLASAALATAGEETAAETPARAAQAPPAEALAAKAPVPQAAADPNTMRVYWSEGLRLDTADRKVRLRIGGRTENDWNYHYADGLSNPFHSVDGVEFRRSRLYLSGEIGSVDFKAEYDFAGGAAVPTDVYVGLTNLPVVGSMKAGHFKEPFGLEELTSSRFTTFVERSLATLAFSPARNMGLMFSNAVLEDRLVWAAGLFKAAGGSGSALGDGSYAFTGRLAGTPWKKRANQLLHLGAAYSHRDSVDELLRVAPRPEAHLAAALVNTGSFPADSSDLLGLEAAFIYDRFSIQSEFMDSFVNSTVAGDPSFSSFYTEGSVFLTHDSRQYSADSAAFDRVRPSRSLLAGEGGYGAWEFAARYSQIKLDDGFVLGGKQKNFTLGLNWYVSPNSKFMFNFVHADPEHDGTLNVLQARFQVDF